jgi:hypothetical protein
MARFVSGDVVVVPFPFTDLSTRAPISGTFRLMITITLTATFDGERIRLEDDFPLTKGTRLLVTVLPGEGEDDRAFREFWHKLAAQSLARAYSPDEPDYTLDMIKEPQS